LLLEARLSLRGGGSALLHFGVAPVLVVVFDEVFDIPKSRGQLEIR
jgi:hypothetical protein